LAAAMKSRRRQFVIERYYNHLGVIRNTVNYVPLVALNAKRGQVHMVNMVFGSFYVHEQPATGLRGNSHKGKYGAWLNSCLRFVIPSLFLLYLLNLSSFVIRERPFKYESEEYTYKDQSCL